MSMKILLTGASGFLGQYVLSQLKNLDIPCITVGRSKLRGNKDHICIDLLSESNIEKVVREACATHLIHLAWYVEHGDYWSSLVNLEWMRATQLLVESFCINGGKHISVAGTCAEYDLRFGYCVEDRTPTSQDNVYGIAKDASRRLSQLICKKYSVPLAWGRIFFPFGIGEPRARLIPSLFSCFLGEKSPFGVGFSCYRDLLHVSDVASAFLIFAINNVDGVYNICSGEPLLIKDLVVKIAKICKKDPNVILKIASQRIGDQEFIVGSNQKLIDCGWCKRVEILQGLHEYYKYLSQGVI